MHLKNYVVASTIAALNAAALSVSAAPFIVVGGSNLLPNQANQQIQLLVTGTEQVAGVTLFAEMDPISGITPAFTNANLISGTIFAANNTGEKGKFVGTGTLSNFLTISTTTNAGTVNLTNTPALLVTLTVNTTGIAAGGLFHLNLNGTLNGNSFFVLANGSKQTSTYASNLFSIDNSADREWNVNGGGTWGSDNNWTTFAPYAAGDIAHFGTFASVPATVTLDGDRVAGAILFNNSSAQYTIARGTGSGTVRLNGPSPSITDASGSHVISAPIALSANTSVSIPNASSTLTISGAISGSSNIALTGLGKLVLSGANSFADASVGTGATLQFATSAAASSTGTTYTNDGNLIYSQTDASLINVAILGSGTLTQAGTGTTTLLGANIYTGPTNISSGTLMIGNNGTTGTLGTGAVSNSSSLVFNRTNLLTVAGLITGSGSTSHLGTGTTTLTNYKATGALSITSGKLVFGENAGARQTAAVLKEASALTITGSSSLNVMNNDLLVHNASYATIFGKIQTGFNGGVWNGPGIISTDAFNSGGATTVGVLQGNDYIATTGSVFDGKTVVGTDVVVKYTWWGDMNLDGLVDDNDLGTFLNFYSGTGGSGVGSYAEGDMNFDGLINDDDLGNFLNNYQVVSQLGHISSYAGGSPSLGLGSTAVPEPASLAVLSLGALAMLRRKRRS